MTPNVCAHYEIAGPNNMACPVVLERRGRACVSTTVKKKKLTLAAPLSKKKLTLAAARRVIIAKLKVKHFFFLLTRAGVIL